jgi:hypothetical protein
MKAACISEGWLMPTPIAGAGEGRPRRSALCISLAALVLGACTSASPLRGSNVYEVSAVSQRGPYLDAVISKPDEVLRFYFENDETCRETVVLNARVEYLAVGRLGRVGRGGETCEAIGVASLQAWLSRRPRPRTRQKPRAQAAYRLRYEDSEVLLARGDFPLAGLIGWTGASDTVAVMPRSEVCLTAVERGVASMEYSTLAAQPFWLVVSNERCPITGFVQPLASATDE